MFYDEYLHHQISCLGVFLVSFLNQLAPTPKEVTLLSIGYSAEHHLINPYFAGFAAFIDLTKIDNVFYWLAFSKNKMIHCLKNTISKKI